MNIIDSVLLFASAFMFGLVVGIQIGERFEARRRTLRETSHMKEPRE